MKYPAFICRESILDHIFEIDKVDITCTYASSSLVKDIDPYDPETAYHHTFMYQCLNLDTSFHSIETQCARVVQSLKSFAIRGGKTPGGLWTMSSASCFTKYSCSYLNT